MVSRRVELHTAPAMRGRCNPPPWAPWFGGGPDVTSSEMPGPSSGPGRRAPVREAAPLLRRSRTTESFVHPMSSLLPPSPPPSPPPMYRFNPMHVHHGAVPRGGDAIQDTNDDDHVQYDMDRCSDDYVLDEGGERHSERHCSRCRDHHSSMTSNAALAPLISPTAFIRTSLQLASRFDVPGTPDMSPANMDVRHQPTAMAEAFLRRIFVNWNASGAYKAEDAGIELLCPGWTGAVVQKHTCTTRSAQLRSLYVHMPRSFDRSTLRDHMLRILDAASDSVCASRVVFCLERDIPDLSSLLHGLCYVGGQLSSLQGQRDEWMQATPLASLVLVAVTL